MLEAQVQKVVALAKSRNGHDEIVRDRLANEWIVQQALKLTNYRALTSLMKTGMPGPEGSAVKLAWSEANQRLTKLAMEILEGEDDGYWRHQQLRSRGNTIEAGTSEILRNIVAERVLGLPRSPLMQFAFTDEQELLRREAREALGNGGWSRDEIAGAELSFLDRAVLYEEGGRANVGESLFDDSRPEDEQFATLALEAVGIAAKALELGVEYASTREQFGRKIGVYQAVSHPLVDIYVETELSRSLAYWAAWCVSEGDEQAPVAAAAAKAYASDAAVAACERSIQVHGGIGFTWEHVAAHVLQARTRDPGVRRLPACTARDGRRFPARLTRRS